MATWRLGRVVILGKRTCQKIIYSTFCERGSQALSHLPSKLFSTETNLDYDQTISLAEVSNLKPATLSVPQWNSFNSRTHTCGELRLADEGASVLICGWLQFKRLDKFLVIKDSYGVTQLLLKDDAVIEDGVSVTHIPLESVVEAEGVVTARPPKMQNPKMATGEVEVAVSRLKVLNACREALPFFSTSTLKHGESNERMRLANRYLDLRMDRMQANIRFRSSLLMRMREFLHDLHGFVDVETPTLFRRTPGGAREFLVPTHNPGEFFCLPQSPQQFKQLLMVGGIDRYFQIAKCYRDEGTKRDRQPEFTQLDIELSFVDRDGVKSLIERLLIHSLSNVKYDNQAVPVPTTPFPTITYDEAMSSYGVDKPDVRFDMKVIDLTQSMSAEGTGSTVFDSCLQAGGCVKCIKVDRGSELLTKSEWKEVLSNESEKVETKAADDELQVESESVEDVAEVASVDSEQNFALIHVKKDSKWKTSSHARFVNDKTRLLVNDHIVARPSDVIVLTQGDDASGLSVALGKLRLKIAKTLESKGVHIYDQPFAWLWVDDFPLFLPAESEGDAASSSTSKSHLESAHHPFTAPHPDDAHLLEVDPLRCRGLHYDLVLNGNEVGGGSIRIHEGEFQRRILKEFLKEETDQMEHLLKALDSGAPPHGGIALGLDRLVAVLVGANSIRDVIAFPKSADFKDLMAKAPASVELTELDYYNISVVPRANDHPKDD